MGFISSFLGGGGAGALIQGVTTIGGALLSAQANKDAAKKAAKATLAGAKARAEGIQKGVDRLDVVRGETGVAPTYLRQVVAAPTELQPWQRQALDESRQATMRGIPWGLRGSGRFVTRAIRDVETGVRNNFLQENQRRADEAARALASPYFNASSRAAELEGTQGEALGSGIADAGLYKANAGTANAGLYGQAIGDIGAIVASQLKPKPSGYRRGGTVTPLRDVFA